MKIEDYMQICQKLNAESLNGMSFRAGVLYTLLLKENDFLEKELKTSLTKREAEMICANLKAISEILNDLRNPPEEQLD